MKKSRRELKNSYKIQIRDLVSQNLKPFLTGVIFSFLLFLVILYLTQPNKNVVILNSNIYPKNQPSLPIDIAIKKITTSSSSLTSQLITPTTKQLDIESMGQIPDEIGQTSSLMSKQAVKRPKTYQVKEGDSLSLIAEKFYGDINAWIIIAAANNLTNPDQITVGLQLKLP